MNDKHHGWNQSSAKVHEFNVFLDLMERKVRLYELLCKYMLCVWVFLCSYGRNSINSKFTQKKLIEREREREWKWWETDRGWAHTVQAWTIHARKTTCVLTLFCHLQQITLKLLHINIHVPEVCKQKKGERGRVCESGGRQIEGEHTQFKHGQSMQEK